MSSSSLDNLFYTHSEIYAKSIRGRRRRLTLTDTPKMSELEENMRKEIQLRINKEVKKKKKRKNNNKIKFKEKKSFIQHHTLK